MKHILSLKLKEKHRCLEKDFSFPLEDITLIVGNQGCGKSSILELLRDNSEILVLELSKECLENGIPSYYFDTEKMNPRTKKHVNDFTNIDGSDRGIGLRNGLSTFFKSHGEILVEFTANRIHQTKNCVLLLDEPESALSLNNQYKLVREIKDSVNRNVQVIVATHCLPLIESFENVYSLEDRMWIKSSEFINKARNSVQ